MHQPPETEPICLVSYEITRVLLGGGPDIRPGFWKAYRKEVAYNIETDYENYHIKLCREQLEPLKRTWKGPVYFRDKRLVTEKEARPV